MVGRTGVELPASPPSVGANHENTVGSSKVRSAQPLQATSQTIKNSRRGDAGRRRLTLAEKKIPTARHICTLQRGLLLLSA